MRTLFVRTLLLLLLFNTTTILTTAQDVKGSTSSNQATFAEGIYNAIFSQDFEHHSAPIEYTTSKWNPDWNNPGWRDGDHRYPEWFAENIKDSIVVDNESGSKVMKFNFTDTIVDGYAGVSPYRGGDYWKVDLGKQSKELYLSYNIKFKPGFVWNEGGKLPATNGGSPLLPATQKDCVRPGYGEGYSSAIMFKDNGGLAWYLFYQDQSNEQWGETHYWDDYQPEGLDFLDNGRLSLDVSKERWYNITLRIVVNSFHNGVPNKDGIMEGFIDGKLVSSLTGLYLLTEPDVNKGVNQIALGQFFGGNENRQAAQRKEWTLLDDFICFTYDESVHVPRGNTPSQPGRVLLLPNLKIEQPEQQDVTPPSVPKGLRATSTTGTNVALLWEASQDNTAVKGYRVFLNGHERGSTKENSFNISELEPNTTYSISVSAYDLYSNESQRSEAIFATTLPEIDTLPPPVPSGIIITGSTQSTISLAWDAIPDSLDFEAFHIYLDGEQVVTTDANQFDLSNLQADTEYTITLTSFDASMNESENSEPLKARTGAPDSQAPSVPGNLHATNVSNNSIDLSWDASVDNIGIAGYRIYMNGIEVDSSISNSHAIFGLNPGVNYSISVSAYDQAHNESANSKEVFVTTENPDHVTTPILPEVKIVDFVNGPSGHIATAIAEIESIGHTELLDFGLMLTKKSASVHENTRDIIYAEKENSKLTHKNRVKDGVQLLYDFTEGEGSTINDKSESGSSVDLIINNPLVTSWLPGQGLKIDNSTLISSQEAPSGLLNSISSTNEITLESWIRTGASDQSGPARIISISEDSKNRVATLGQSGDNDSYNYIARLSTTTTSSNGTPEVSSQDDFNGLNLHHVVYTRSGQGVEKIHINGEEKYSGIRDGDIAISGENNYLTLANELSGTRPWIGNYYLVAVYDKALDETDISRNYEAGTGIVSYTTNMDLEHDESYIVTPFARTVQGISYGEPVELDAENILHNIKEDSISITIYPNPSDGDFTVNVLCNVTDTQVAYLRVSDMMGQIIYNERLNIAEIAGENQLFYGGNSGVLTMGKDIQVSLSSLLKDGIYLVSLIVGDQTAGSRLIIQH